MMPRCVSLDEIPFPYIPHSLDLRKLHPQNGKSVVMAMELSGHIPGVSSPISSIITPSGSPLNVIVSIVTIRWRIFFDHCFFDQ